MRQFVLLVVISLYMTPIFGARSDIHPELNEILIALRELCSAKIGVTHHEIESYKITNDDHKFKCYMSCIMIQGTWMTPDGELHIENMKRDASYDTHKDIYLPIVEQCSHVQATSDPCQTAYDFNVCFEKTSPEHYFLV